jgi:leucyl-tRNA synthetase
MPPVYDFKSIEAQWQQRWHDSALFRAADDSAKDGFYLLTMFPYPSGTLHMGHVIVMTITDVAARFNLMRGLNVMNPMGWDALGLPAENAAIKTHTPPQAFTRKNIDRMREQMKKAGWGFDWARECSTAHPGYYKWTQWLFLQFWKKGLAVQKPGAVNWCDGCQTVLANEQVLADNTCERCGGPIEQRDMVQWYFRMSQYAQRLLDGHDKLEGKWPERVIKNQREWIGRSEGARVDFTIKAPGCKSDGKTLSVFTTRPDTLWGVTFMSVAPEHPLVAELVAGTPREKEVMEAARRMRNQSRIARMAEGGDKEGVFTGRHVVNPVNNETVPLWVANFALMEYGTGAVMSVPAHDTRDFAFAKAFNLPIRIVIQPEGETLDAASMKDAYIDDGLMVDSGPFDGKHNRKDMPALIDWLAAKKFGAKTVNFRLRDWLLSRQRYWGVPIPLIHCPKCGVVPVPDDKLPVILPENVEFKPTGESPLARCADFVNVKCPKCGSPAKRETDTMDTFVDSSWYFLRYCSPRHQKAAWDPALVKQWMPVDQYIGGAEHSNMHLIYARFFTMVLHDLGMLDFDEPFERLFCQGMVCMEAYRCPVKEHGWTPLKDVDTDTWTHKGCGKVVEKEMSKMSKTKLNSIAPDEMLDKYGADTLHLMMVSDTPPEQDRTFLDRASFEKKVYTSHRFIQRLNDIMMALSPSLRSARPYSGDGADLTPAEKDLRRAVHSAIQSVTRDMNFRFNTAVSQYYVLADAINKAREANVRPEVMKEALLAFSQIAAPILPHVCEEWWSALGNSESVFRSKWPEPDARALAQDTVQIPVQVNGKHRATLTLPAGSGEDAIKSAALADENVKKHIEGKTVRKVIVVGGGKLVSVVAG